MHIDCVLNLVLCSIVDHCAPLFPVMLHVMANLAQLLEVAFLDNYVHLS